MQQSQNDTYANNPRTPTDQSTDLFKSKQFVFPEIDDYFFL